MRRWITTTQTFCATAAMLCWLATEDAHSHPAQSKARPTPPPKAQKQTNAKTQVRPPSLKILSVNPTPLPFVMTAHPLTLTILVELPKTLPEETLLNVTTLITSPSRSSIRVLESRRPLMNQTGSEAPGNPQRIEIVQQWDGTDQTKGTVPDGTYTYHVVAKLMAPGKSGLLTQTTSWATRGSFEVSAR